MLECISGAVAKYRESLATEELDTTVLDPNDCPVKIKHVMLVVREEKADYVDRIQGLPTVAQAVLCVAVILGQNSSRSTIKLGTLRSLAAEPMQQVWVDDDSVPLEVYQHALQQLFDAGLLQSGEEDPSFDASSQNWSNLQEMPLSLGVQLEDVESALWKTLGDEPVFKTVIEKSREMDFRRLA